MDDLTILQIANKVMAIENDKDIISLVEKLHTAGITIPHDLEILDNENMEAELRSYEFTSIEIGHVKDFLKALQRTSNTFQGRILKDISSSDNLLGKTFPAWTPTNSASHREQSRDRDEINQMTIAEAARVTMAKIKDKETIINALESKLQEQGVTFAMELLRTSENVLETKLLQSAAFSLDEVAHVITLRSYIHRLSTKPSDRHRGRCDRQHRQRSRSRSPRLSNRNRKGHGKGSRRKDAWKENCKGRCNHRRRSPEKPELWAAVERGDVNKVKASLDTCDIEEKYKGWSPLMKAAEENRIEILQMLLDAKADLEVTNRKGRTALSFAADPSMNRPTATGTLELLLKADANTKQQDAMGFTAKARCGKDLEKRKDALVIFDLCGK